MDSSPAPASDAPPLHSRSLAWQGLAARFGGPGAVDDDGVMAARRRRNELVDSMPASELADYIVNVCYPQSLIPSDGEQITNSEWEGAAQMFAFERREDITAADLSRLVSRHVEYAEGDAETRRRFFRDFDESLAKMVRHVSDATPELLGSICRVLYRSGWRGWGKLAGLLTTSLLLNPATPVEVSSRLMVDASRLQPDLVEGVTVLVKVADKYPDLGGLPQHLQVGVAATLPLPSEWWVEVWSEPAEFPPAKNWHVPPLPVWDELLFTD